MLLKNLVDLAKATQGAVEDYFGLHAKAEPGPWDSQLKTYKPLCKALGVGLFGIELAVYSPTGKELLRLGVEWSFEVSGEDADEDESPGESWWRLHTVLREETDCHRRPRPPLSPDAELRRVELSVSPHGWHVGPDNRTDLRCYVREKLKKAFPKVAVSVADPPR